MNEQILLTWNDSIHADLQETLRLWEVVKEIKDFGHGEVRIIIRDGVIVGAETQKKWVKKGGDFAQSDL